MINGTKVIDFHGHVGRWDYVGLVDDSRLMIRAMDDVGIDLACLFNIFHPDGVRANDQTAAFVALRPDRFIGFAYVSPMMPNSMVPELERALDRLGFYAIKLYSPYTPYEYNHPIWDPVYQVAQDREIVVIAHTGSNGEPKYLGKAAQRFPNAKFVAAHAGNEEPFRTQAMDVARSYENFFLETCSTYRTPGVIEELVEKVGADRVLYGSDMPLMDPRSQIGKIITADISNDDKLMILGKNAKKILNISQ